MREKVVFIHMEKCGGTTLRHLLADEYPHDEIHPVAIGPKSKVSPPYPFVRVDAINYMLKLTPEDIMPYRLVMSHYDWRITWIADDAWHFMTMLRDPVRQLLSRYFFIERARDLHGDEWERTATRGFHHWLEHHATQYANIQTKLLGLGDVNVAIRNLAHPQMTFGLVEQYTESVRRFNVMFGWTLPNPPRYNRADVDTDRYHLPDETVALAREIQHKDVKVYAAAVDLFGEQTLPIEPIEVDEEDNPLVTDDPIEYLDK